MQMMMNGSRLEFVVVPVAGKVNREVCRLKKGEGIQREGKMVDGGFMVYFPRGHVLRLRNKAELQHYNLDRKPNIINIQGLHDPNSPVGRLLAAQDDGARRGAMESMQAMVIKLATAKTGPMLMPEQLTAPSKEAA